MKNLRKSPIRKGFDIDYKIKLLTSEIASDTELAEEDELILNFSKLLITFSIYKLINSISYLLPAFLFLFMLSLLFVISLIIPAVTNWDWLLIRTWIFKFGYYLKAVTNWGRLVIEEKQVYPVRVILEIILLKIR